MPNRLRLPWLLAGILTLLGSSPLSAPATRTLPYYGYLSEPSGDPLPDALYDLTFHISSGSSVVSAAVWSEVHAGVPVTEGRFFAELGSITPFNFDFDDDWFLWVRVNGTDQYLPKDMLGMSPQAMTLRLPFRGTENGTGAALDIGNSGAGPAIRTDGDLEVGSTSQTGTALVFESGKPQLIGKIGAYSTTGGQANVNDENAAILGGFQVVGPGPGSTMTVEGGVTGLAFALTSTPEPYLGLWGPARDFVVDLSQSGTDAAQLPVDAINALERWNEAGAAHRSLATSQPVSSSITVLSSQSIVLPVSGYVLAVGTAVIQNGTSWFGFYGVSDSPSAFPSNQQVSLFLSAVDYQVPVTSTGLFFANAGLNDFYFLGQAFGPGLTQSADKIALTLIFIPTSYGTINPTAVGPPPLGTEGREQVLDAAAERRESEAAYANRLRAELDEQAARMRAIRERWEEYDRAAQGAAGGGK